MAWKPKTNFEAHGWQRDAIDAWEQSERRGVVEAVTGSGKTYAAFEAMVRVLREHGAHASILIVVPTVTLLDQWCDRLQEAFPGQRLLPSGPPYPASSVAAVSATILPAMKTPATTRDGIQ